MKRTAAIGLLVALIGLGCAKSSSGTTSSADDDAPATPVADKPSADKSGADKPGANKPGANKPSANKPSLMNSKIINDVVLSWKMTKTNTSIEVSYSIENKSKQPVYVCDELLVMIQKTKTWRAFPAVSVQNISDQPDTARVVVGTPPTDVESFVIDPVTFVPIKPGATLSATREIPLPMKSYNSMGMTEPLNKSITKAVLVVQSFRGDPPGWRELPGDKGVIKVADGFTPEDLVSNPIDLPLK